MYRAFTCRINLSEQPALVQLQSDTNRLPTYLPVLPLKAPSPIINIVILVTMRSALDIASYQSKYSARKN